MLRYLTNIINRSDKRILFIAFSLILIINALVLNRVIITDRIYFNTYADQLEHDRINTLIRYRKSLEWIGYLLIPLILAAKLFIVSISIQIGLILINYKTSIKIIFQVVLISESVIILAQIIRIGTLYLLDFNTLDDIFNFYPLSVMNIVSTGNVHKWFIYPLKMANMFIITYFLVLTYGLSVVLKRKPLKMLLFTLGTYGLCLSLWIMIVMFINIYFS